MRDGDGPRSRRRPAAQPRQVRDRGVALNSSLPSGLVGVGVDLVDTARFAATVARTPSIVTRVFTPAEIALCGGDRLRTDSLAARWAAKEAVAKVLVDTGGLVWHDCEVLGGEHGQPRLEVRGTVADAARARGIDSWFVSLSHDGGMAIAFVVAAAGGPGGTGAPTVRTPR